MKIIVESAWVILSPTSKRSPDVSSLIRLGARCLTIGGTDDPETTLDHGSPHEVLGRKHFNSKRIARVYAYYVALCLLYQFENRTT